MYPGFESLKWLITFPNFAYHPLTFPTFALGIIMPAGYSSRCKACNSPNRLQIEVWRQKDGLSTRTISAMLKESGELISYRALDNHFSEHYNVPAEIEEQYTKSQVNLQQEASEGVSEIKILDSMMESKHRLHQTLDSILTNRLAGLAEKEEDRDLPKLPMAYVSLYTGCATGICQAMKTKQELLGEDGAARQAKAMETWVDLMLEEDEDDDHPTDQGATQGDTGKSS